MNEVFTTKTLKTFLSLNIGVPIINSLAQCRLKEAENVQLFG